ncbi:PIG-L deacetylase family protein [Polymorphobacter fuscus]|uniref:PIG-L family deacetylase n=1 Tax=Sandarakinorhabdus fusca TaxID=1439888 RepID=A0A7C9KZI0_9SPHN|nr:PIG-L family deacetylase [Polymorphobacter fuscus]KAB7645580.1 PIG-L family deacetylase [Polymorphobacter fuscus]MQT18028.1 PIG-L family deacetylase [Polymorphobacter fuscus]NJC08661.1 LmbE family N-acetylglucosaminyl deacetylase [Polymorphobacter fuscus]
MNTCPVPAFRRLLLSRRFAVRLAAGASVVILAPHPDDETLGCGLLIARLVRAGVPVTVVALSDGDASHPGSRRWPPADLARLRRSELRRALHRLGAGAARLRFMGWPDGAVAASARPARLAAVCHAARAGLVLATSPDDHHPDHKACFAVGAAVARRLAMPLVTYAVWSRLADPGQARDFDRHRGAKTWAMAAHRSQVSDYIADAPDGFRLSSRALRQFIRQPERYRPAACIVRRTHGPLGATGGT